MQFIEVKKEALLEKLKENRDKHRKLFEEALDGWEKRVVEELKKAVSDAKAKREFRTTFFLPQPVDHTSEYDAIIEQVEWDVNETIELSPQQFNQFVRDDWGWKEDFLNNTSFYVGKKFERG